MDERAAVRTHSIPPMPDMDGWDENGNPIPEPEEVPMDAKMAEWFKYQQDERDRKIDRAFDALNAAQKELDELRANLVLAVNGEPYMHFGRVDGVDAQAMFNAFGAIESVAQFEQYLARKDA